MASSDKIPGYTPDAYPQQNAQNGVKLHTTNQLNKISQAFKGINNYLGTTFPNIGGSLKSSAAQIDATTGAADGTAHIGAGSATASVDGSGNMTIPGTLTATGAVAMSGTLTVTGAVTIGGHVPWTNGNATAFGNSVMGAANAAAVGLATVPVGAPQLSSEARTGSIAICIGDGVSPILPGFNGLIRIPFACTLVFAQGVPLGGASISTVFGINGGSDIMDLTYNGSNQSQNLNVAIGASTYLRHQVTSNPGNCTQFSFNVQFTRTN